MDHREYPIRISGIEQGALRLSREGLYTRLEARLPPSAELTRLWLWGEGESCYLGLMEPRAGERLLLRRLSALEMSALPKSPICACDRPQPLMTDISTEKPKEESPEPKDQPQSMKDNSPEPKSQPPEPEEEPQKPKSHAEKPKEEPQKPKSQPPQPKDEPQKPKNRPEGLEELLWLRRRDGSLCAYDQSGGLLALPASLRAPVPGARLLRYEGREYMVFRY